MLYGTESGPCPTHDHTFDYAPPQISTLNLTIFQLLLLALAATLGLVSVFISRYQSVAAIYRSERLSPLLLSLCSTAKYWLPYSFSIKYWIYPIHLSSPLAISWQPLRRISISTPDSMRGRQKSQLLVFEWISFTYLIYMVLVFLLLPESILWFRIPINVL